jgi:hypothetical protein
MNLPSLRCNRTSGSLLSTVETFATIQSHGACYPRRVLSMPLVPEHVARD